MLVSIKKLENLHQRWDFQQSQLIGMSGQWTDRTGQSIKGYGNIKPEIFYSYYTCLTSGDYAPNHVHNFLSNCGQVWI